MIRSILRIQPTTAATNRRRTNDVQDSRRTEMDGLLRALIKTVRRRLRADEEVTVEAVTKELGYTRQYISGRFHRITGRLPSHFLQEKRLEKAARLLKSGNMRGSQIGRRCGVD